jgi:hypothetical protein
MLIESPLGRHSLLDTDSTSAGARLSTETRKEIDARTLGDVHALVPVAGWQETTCCENRPRRQLVVSQRRTDPPHDSRGAAA